VLYYIISSDCDEGKVSINSKEIMANSLMLIYGVLLNHESGVFISLFKVFNRVTISECLATDL
jgi:hypothetical protein